MTLRVHPWLQPVVWFGPVVWLWFSLIRQLSVEWSLNPQYAYGWAVPFLCAYLIWKRARRPEAKDRGSDSTSAASPAPVTTERAGAGSRPAHPGLPPPSPGFQLVFALLAFLLLPARLVQEANPQWRTAAWFVALVYVGVTLCVIRLALGARRLTQTAFPLGFFLVAVPWPTVLAAPLMQALTRANAAVSVELLNTCGIPALQHGNVIEVATGLVGIDEACSGIRSLQATLMLALFFGELHRLPVVRRLSLCLAGFGLAFVFNLGRSTLLTAVAAREGVGALERWHDPAGVTILVGCFTGLWLVSLAVRPGRASRPAPGPVASAPRAAGGAPPASESGSSCLVKSSATGSSGPSPFSSCGDWPPSACESVRFVRSVEADHLVVPARLRAWPLALCLWITLVFLGVELWFRAHEHNLKPQPVWTVVSRTEVANAADVPIPDSVKSILRFSAAENIRWQDAAGLRWQMVFMRWSPGRIAAHAAQGHNPQGCLTSTGRKLLASSPTKVLEFDGLGLPFQQYDFEDEGHKLHVMYCLWQDHTAAQGFTRGETKSLRSRLQGVWTGRRNLGQRSLELAVWGIDDPAAAEAALRAQLAKLIVVQPASAGDANPR